METHGKGLTEKVDGQSQGKMDSTDDRRFKVGDEENPHDLKQHNLAASRQPQWGGGVSHARTTGSQLYGYASENGT
jgi:hypothetical protein